MNQTEWTESPWRVRFFEFAGGAKFARAVRLARRSADMAKTNAARVYSAGLGELPQPGKTLGGRRGSVTCQGEERSVKCRRSTDDWGRYQSEACPGDRKHGYGLVMERAEGIQTQTRSISE